ncbi:MAG TPA: hypothetical protein V6D02_08435 [Candidatus Obscuribacterales bacterium]
MARIKSIEGNSIGFVPAAAGGDRGLYRNQWVQRLSGGCIPGSAGIPCCGGVVNVNLAGDGRSPLAVPRILSKGYPDDPSFEYSPRWLITE